jgi:RNA 2',3'-cyclic 3'-phosphodiesterase
LSFRAFISADIEPCGSLVALLDQLRQARADLKVVKAANRHVTLKFLGDTDEGAVDQITDRMRGSVEGIGPFTVRLEGIGAFPSMSNIRVVWIGMNDGRPLAEMAARLDRSLEVMGLERDRKGFKPHLTVARARSERGLEAVQELIATNPATDFGEYRIDRISLKKSVLTPKGPLYTNVTHVMLPVD